MVNFKKIHVYIYLYRFITLLFIHLIQPHTFPFPDVVIKVIFFFWSLPVLRGYSRLGLFIIYHIFTQSNMLFTWVAVCLDAKHHAYERLVRIPKPQVELSKADEISWRFLMEILNSK